MEDYDVNFRVLPFIDTDVSRLFTQTYSMYTALGRWDYIFSSEIGPIAFKNRWLPVTIAETVHYKRSIKNFEKVRLQTKVVCWNEKAFFLQQTFFVNGQIRAIAYSEGIVRGPAGHLRPAEAFKVFGTHLPSPEMPKEIEAWHSMRNPEDATH